MPIIFEPEDLRVIKKNRARVAVLANSAMLGTNALQVERIDLKESAKTSLFEAVDGERFIYVIRGTGQADIGQEKYPLRSESVLWLEREDTFLLEAGSDGLEVLLCHAPASE